jgi:hypothetical protein
MVLSMARPPRRGCDPLQLTLKMLWGGEFSRSGVADGSKRLVGERQLAGIEPSTPAFRR